MSVWTALRSLFRPHGVEVGRRTSMRPSIRPTLEELEGRNAPGALLGGFGQTPVSLLGSPSPSVLTKASAGAVSSVVRTATPVAASTTSTLAGATTTVTAAKGAGTGQGLSSAAEDSSQDPLTADPSRDFADLSSSPGSAAAAPAAAADAAGAGNSVSPPPSNAGGVTPQAQSTDGGAITPADATTPTPVQPTPPTVTLTAPPFANYQGATLVVSAQANGAGNSLVPQVYIDVDLRHDGKFTDSGDASFVVGQLNANGTATLTLPPTLAKGTYNIRARVNDLAGNTGLSATQTITVNASSGYNGSQALLDLAYGLPYGTPVNTTGATSTTPVKSGGAPNLKDFSFLEFDPQGRVLVNVHATLPQYLTGLQTDLQSQFGFSTTAVTTKQDMVTGWLPTAQILNLPNLANFDSVTPVYKPFTKVGSVTTEGDAVIKANTFRATTGDDGTGEKVGVISDSVNEFGGGLAQSVATGDLPNNVQVLGDDPNGNGTDEGRAMLEIVHDVAPGAPLAFDAAGNTAQNMATSINNLVGVGSKVIADDVGFFDEPFFNDGVITQAAEAAVNSGVVYTSAAGNNSNHGYLANWNPINATVGGVSGTFQDITGTGSPLQTFTLGLGDTVTLSFEWDSAYLEGGAGTGNLQVNNDLQVVIADQTGNTLATPQVFNSGGTNVNEAFQLVQFTNDGTYGTNNFSFAFNLVSGAAPGTIAWVSQDDGNTADDPMALKEGAPTLYGHPNGTGVLGVGAVNWQTPTTPEAFTAQGRMPILFDVNGNRLATPLIRPEPEVAGPDGVHTSFFDPNNGHIFFGTSAATPHVAGAAALLLQQGGTVTGAQVATQLETTALDVNPPGFDNLTGNGLIQLTAITVTPPPPTPTPIVTNPEAEVNQTSDTALNLGVLAVGAPTSLTNLNIAPLPLGQNDYDWFAWTAGQAATFTATETTTAGGNLELHLFTLQGNTLVQLANSTVIGVRTQALSTVVAAGQEILVEVKGQNQAFGVMSQANYQLTASLT